MAFGQSGHSFIRRLINIRESLSHMQFIITPKLNEWTDYFVKQWINSRFNFWKIWNTPPDYSTVNSLEPLNK